MRCVVTIFAVFFAACPGRITNPEQFTNASLAFSCDPSIDVQRDIVRPYCAISGCHSAIGPAADLDLDTPGVALRIYGQHASGCPKQLLLDPQNPFGGFFFDKLTETKPACGVQMPQVGDKLTKEEVACMHLWLATELEAAAAAE
jgi:hypothetical protein